VWQLAISLKQCVVKNLESLDIRLQVSLSKLLCSDQNSDCTYALLEALSKGHHPLLRVLRLRNFMARDMGLEIATILTTGKLRSLKVLDLSGNALGEEGALALSTALAHPQTDLVEMDLRGNILTECAANYLGVCVATSKHVPSLEKVDLCNNFTALETTEAWLLVKDIQFVLVSRHQE
jgi:Ran GTPase-activating protein (RanGAP) involved in mRNA processing and transport